MPHNSRCDFQYLTNYIRGQQVMAFGANLNCCLVLYSQKAKVFVFVFLHLKWLKISK